MWPFVGTCKEKKLLFLKTVWLSRLFGLGLSLQTIPEVPPLPVSTPRAKWTQPSLAPISVPQVRCLHLLLCPLGAQLRLSSLLKQSQWVSLDLNPRGMKQRSLLQALRSLSQRSSHCLAHPRLSQRSLSCLLLLSPSQRSAHLCHTTSCTLQACHTTHTPARAATPHPRLPGLPCHVLHHLYQPCSK